MVGEHTSLPRLRLLLAPPSPTSNAVRDKFLVRPGTRRAAHVERHPAKAAIEGQGGLVRGYTRAVSIHPYQHIPVSICRGPSDLNPNVSRQLHQPAV